MTLVKGNRAHRRKALRLALKGKYPVGVVGKDREGFQVVVRRGESLVPLGGLHRRLYQASAYGKNRTGQDECPKLKVA